MATQIARRPGFRARPTDLAMKSITVDAAPEAVYRAWRDPEAFPRFLSFVEAVSPHSETRSHWVCCKGGDTVEWDVDLVEDRPDRALAWRSIPGSDVELD